MANQTLQKQNLLGRPPGSAIELPKTTELQKQEVWQKMKSINIARHCQYRQLKKLFIYKAGVFTYLFLT